RRLQIDLYQRGSAIDRRGHQGGQQGQRGDGRQDAQDQPTPLEENLPIFAQVDIVLVVLAVLVKQVQRERIPSIGSRQGAPDVRILSRRQAVVAVRRIGRQVFVGHADLPRWEFRTSGRCRGWAWSPGTGAL